MESSSSDLSWIQMRWNRTGRIDEDIRFQRDKIPRRKIGMYPIPGYMGHIPDHNPPSSTAFKERPDAKQKMLLFELDQYSREYWPHYKGFKPQVENNVKERNPPPAAATTYEYYNKRAERVQAMTTKKTQPKRAAHKSGVKSFFSSNTDSVSANGVGMAEGFYKHARPYAGSLLSLQAEKALASRYL